MDHYEMRKAFERALHYKMKISKHSVWLMVSNRQRVDKLVDVVSATNYSEIVAHAMTLANEFSAIEDKYLLQLSELEYDDPLFEATLATDSNMLLLQMMLNGEDYAPLIWKMIEPERVDVKG